MNKYIIPAAVIVIIAIAVIFFSQTNNTEFDSATSQAPTPVTGTNNPTRETEEDSSTVSTYKNGTYNELGNYVSPGGPREVKVRVTLQNGVIADTEFEGLATDPTSQRFQGEFAENYESMVVGKSIDEVELSKVAGSSLTPIGFNDALEKIKAQARS